ncbi:MAG: nucleotide exchange factor GrpE [bacterium]|nr:nucleotide exchange factor GrpE [bacterium]
MEKEEKKNKKEVKENKELKHLEEENHKLKNELKESSEKVLRLAAEMQNYKKRNETEKSNMLKYANEDLAKSLLPILDNFERAIKLDDNDLSDEVSKFLSGFKMIYGSFVNVLNDIEVKEIDCDGLEFDPVYHQAVLTEKDENKPSGVVLEVLQKGYMYKDKVIRPAMVKVNE